VDPRRQVARRTAQTPACKSSASTQSRHSVQSVRTLNSSSTRVRVLNSASCAGPIENRVENDGGAFIFVELEFSPAAGAIFRRGKREGGNSGRVECSCAISQATSLRRG